MKKGVVALLIVVCVAFITQFLLIYFLPQIVYKVGVMASKKPYNTLINAPKTDSRLRRVVLPNPDFIYSAVLYDVSEHDIVLTGEFPDTAQYASIGFYGNDVQPYRVINNIDAGSGRYSIRLTTSEKTPTNKFVVKAKTAKGSILIRMLVTDSLQASKALEIQNRLKVEVQ
jgi:uncharacterized membrane protein